MDKQDTRWKQRLLNFSTVMSHLDKALLIENLDFLQKAGIIQLFEISFELSWKLLKDYLVVPDKVYFHLFVLFGFAEIEVFLRYKKPPSFAFRLRSMTKGGAGGG